MAAGKWRNKKGGGGRRCRCISSRDMAPEVGDQETRWIHVEACNEKIQKCTLMGVVYWLWMRRWRARLAALGSGARHVYVRHRERWTWVWVTRCANDGKFAWAIFFLLLLSFRFNPFAIFVDQCARIIFDTRSLHFVFLLSRNTPIRKAYMPWTFLFYTCPEHWRKIPGFAE